MHKIAICDDLRSELDKVEEMLMLYSGKKNIDFSIKRFEEAEVMLNSIYKKEYIPDLIIADIYLKELSGVDAVAKLRNRGFDIPVIFITMSSEHALEAYDLDVLQYLLKPIDKDKLFHALDISFSYIGKREEDQLVIKMTEGVCRVYPDSIIYCETKKNYQIFYMDTDTYKARMTSLELFEILKKYPQFIKCGNSYIVNLNHVIRVNKEEIYIDNGDKVFLPRNMVAEFKQTYFDFFCDVT